MATRTIEEKQQIVDKFEALKTSGKTTDQAAEELGIKAHVYYSCAAALKDPEQLTPRKLASKVAPVLEEPVTYTGVTLRHRNIEYTLRIDGDVVRVEGADGAICIHPGLWVTMRDELDGLIDNCEVSDA